MRPFASCPPAINVTSLTLCLLFFFVQRDAVVEGTTFAFVNRCGGTVWPGILSNAGSARLETTGFELPPGASLALQAPTGWSGRFWARTGCAFDGSGRGTCATGDCGSGQVECNGAGAAPPVTLAEFTLAGSASGQDFYDVSLVDGYNLPMIVEGGGSGGGCAATGCAADLNAQCPAELRVGEGEGEACRSACGAFGRPEYCCSGAYASPAACRPSVYSQVFKAACPRSYSYAFDDPTSTFTCGAGADYTVTFCPASSPSSSEKATRDPPPPPPAPPITTTGGEEVVLEDESWLAGLATAVDDASSSSSSATTPSVSFPFLPRHCLVTATIACLLFLLLL